ncbi:unnamed protein product [Moneuplotes crassus]|uniref:Cytochrome P450 n=2 Tax=Euplotes crassus TaxID=5936 RepID=A0AAD1UDA9_EUPCR|nr:unnamed protein product [Moneuplotes crassus]
MVIEFVGLLVLLVALYLVNKIVVAPTLFRMKYRRYPNVQMSSEATLFKGDHALVEKNVANNAFGMWYYYEIALSDNKPDLYVKFIGPEPMFVIYSTKALAQLKKLTPSKIDRDETFANKFLGKIFPTSFTQAESGDNWRARRNSLMKAMGLNYASGYIQKLLSCMEQVASQWKPGTKLDFTKDFAEVEFLFMTKVLFGKEFDLQNFLFDYEQADGKIEQMDMQRVMQKIALDTFEGYLSPLGTLFPFINDYNLLPPYTRIVRNVNRLTQRLHDFLKTCDDEDAVYLKLKNEGVFTEDELIQDMLLQLFAGSDTTSHSVVALFYYIKKNPEVYEKLVKLYEQQGITKNGDLQRDKVTVEGFENCEYAEYVIKELLRLDVPTVETVSYKSLEDVEICGVPIKKGNLFTLGVAGFHLDKKHWHEPMKFIPERFDPESEYFNSPTTGKARDPLSFVPFSTGLRGCPGQTFAKLTMKIALPFFLSNLDYDVDEGLLKNEKVNLSNVSHLHLEIDIKANKLHK